jgi:hypothetical protein
MDSAYGGGPVPHNEARAVGRQRSLDGSISDNDLSMVRRVASLAELALFLEGTYVPCAF